MRWWGRFAAATMLSVVVAVVLSALPGLDRAAKPGDRGMEVFGSGRAGKLSQDNLADVLAGFPFRTELLRAHWDPPVLSVDLALPEQAEEDAVFGDLYRIARLASSLTNVEEVRARVFDGRPETSGPTTLLVSLAARREDAKRFMNTHTEDPAEMERLLGSSFRLLYTRHWKERFTESDG